MDKLPNIGDIVYIKSNEKKGTIVRWQNSSVNLAAPAGIPLTVNHCYKNIRGATFKYRNTIRAAFFPADECISFDSYLLDRI